MLAAGLHILEEEVAELRAVLVGEETQTWHTDGQGQGPGFWYF